MSMQPDKKRTVRRVFAWAFVAVWAMVILGFSGQDGEESGVLSNQITQLLFRVFTGVPGDATTTGYRTLHVLVRKAAHMAEYAILGIGAQTALFQYHISTSVRSLGTVIGCFLLACLDEWKQTLVQGRSGRFTDVLIDTSGALIGCLLFFLLLYLLERHRNQQATIRKNE